MVVQTALIALIFLVLCYLSILLSALFAFLAFGLVPKAQNFRAKINEIVDACNSILGRFQGTYLHLNRH